MSAAATASGADDVGETSIETVAKDLVHAVLDRLADKIRL